VFTGTLNYAPNVQGIRWFAERVWPIVRGQVPEVTLDVVGRDPSPPVKALGRIDGITVRGAVPEIAPYLARAHVVVIPVLTGAGIRVKIIEGMAAGRAMVSTSRGAEGLPHLEAGKHLLIADSPQDFASAVIRVLHDSALRNRLADAARDLFERAYDWRRLGDQEEAVIRMAAESPQEALV
jgi:glycosyltransferase involved in cell wall biosynthesis